MSKELLFSITKKDFKVEHFSCGGHGGQNVNRRKMGTRITHIASEAVGESREERSQLQNKKNAFRRCIKTEKFKKWHKIKTSEILFNLESIEKAVDKMMDEKNIKIEYL